MVFQRQQTRSFLKQLWMSLSSSLCQVLQSGHPLCGVWLCLWWKQVPPSLFLTIPSVDCIHVSSFAQVCLFFSRFPCHRTRYFKTQTLQMLLKKQGCDCSKWIGLLCQLSNVSHKSHPNVLMQKMEWFSHANFPDLSCMLV